MSEPDSEWRYQSLTWHALNLFFVGVISLALYSNGLFGVKQATEAASRDVFYRVWSVHYPATGAPNVNVVLLTDESLGATGLWPAPYEKHAALLQGLVRLRPKALFIDISFIDERPDPTIENFKNALAGLAAAGMKIYLLAAHSGSGALRPIRSDLMELSRNGTVRLVSAQLGRENGDLTQYDLASPDGYPPAALAMCRDAAQCRDLPALKEFEPWWAAPPYRLNCERLPEPKRANCGFVSPNVVTRFARLLFNYSLGDAQQNYGVDESDPISVPYHATAFWEEVAGASLSPELEKKLEGSFVFYGLHVAMIRDDARTPVYGDQKPQPGGGTVARRTLPGVYYHAMAFDNLMTLGRDVIRDVKPFGMSQRMDAAMTIAICCLMAFFFRPVMMAFGWVQHRKWSDLIVITVTAVAIAVVEFAFLRISPANWIGITSVVLLSDWLGWADWLADKVFDRYA